MRYGYACINLTLAAQKIVVNRSMMKRTFIEKGIAYTSSLALFNFVDLEDPLTIATAHADYVYDKVNTYKRRVDIMFEAKAKELAVMKYLKDIARV